uniref:Putative ovule protein n=1 Tax=Solanum chacoense TaxID=4108 RepID=A0A0V0HEP6_SOLCH
MLVLESHCLLVGGKKVQSKDPHKFPYFKLKNCPFFVFDNGGVRTSSCIPRLIPRNTCHFPLTIGIR